MTEAGVARDQHYSLDDDLAGHDGADHHRPDHRPDEPSTTASGQRS